MLQGLMRIADALLTIAIMGLTYLDTYRWMLSKATSTNNWSRPRLPKYACLFSNILIYSPSYA